jgi:predicted DNA-binding transcriptional regulator YafY
MRYENAKRLLELVRELQSRPDGMSIMEIAGRFSVGRRTAERMRAAIEEVFGAALEERLTGDSHGTKTWRLANRPLSALNNVDARDLAALIAGTNVLERDNRQEEANALANLILKISDAIKPQYYRRIEPDFEVLTLGQGLMAVPGPRPLVNAAVASVLRNAILVCRKIRVRYCRREDDQTVTRTLEPYGFLFARRHYLVAHSGRARAIRMFELSRITKATILDKSFEFDPTFSLTEYTSRSFGVYQGDPVDVVLRFRADVADEVCSFRFHPSQVIEKLNDGCTEVRFRAAGQREMCWHLFTWGDAVEIVSPVSLREFYRELLLGSITTV